MKYTLASLTDRHDSAYARCAVRLLPLLRRALAQNQHDEPMLASSTAHQGLSSRRSRPTINTPSSLSQHTKHKTISCYEYGPTHTKHKTISCYQYGRECKHRFCFLFCIPQRSLQFRTDRHTVNSKNVHPIILCAFCVWGESVKGAASSISTAVEKSIIWGNGNYRGVAVQSKGPA